MEDPLKSFKWLVCIYAHGGGVRFIKEGALLTTDMNESLVYNSYSETRLAVISLNEHDKGDIDLLINHPYVVMPHPQSVIDFVKEEMERNENDPPC